MSRQFGSFGGGGGFSGGVFGSGSSGFVPGQFGKRTSSASAPFSPLSLGSAMNLYFNAGLIPGNDGDILATVPNLGTENDYHNIGTGDVTLSVESGEKAVNIPEGAILEGLSTTPALSEWAFYAAVKVGDVYSNKYWFNTFKFSGIKAIILGFVADKFEYYETPRTEVGNASVSAYTLIKCTVGTTAEGEWRFCSQGDTSCKIRAAVAMNRLPTSEEEANLDTWFAQFIG